jgi:hypothetical protein
MLGFRVVIIVPWLGHVWAKMPSLNTATRFIPSGAHVGFLVDSTNTSAFSCQTVVHVVTCGWWDWRANNQNIAPRAKLHHHTIHLSISLDDIQPLYTFFTSICCHISECIVRWVCVESNMAKEQCKVNFIYTNIYSSWLLKNLPLCTLTLLCT